MLLHENLRRATAHLHDVASGWNADCGILLAG